MKKWTRWQDWVVIAAGLYAAVSTIWVAHVGAAVAMMLTLGILLIASGVWNLTRPGLVAMEWVQVALGVLLFLSPWFGVYATATSAAWTSWICGVVAVAAGALAIQPAMRMHNKAIPH